MHHRITSVAGTTVFFVVFVLFASTASSAQGIVDLEIDGNEVTASISLLLFEADLSIEFEDVVGLSASNLGISAQTVSVTSLLSRLPSLTSLTSGFPVLLTIEPPSTGGLSFSGVYTLEIHTHDLSFTSGCTYRLFKADNGGTFRDVTTSMGTGSYRVRSQSPSFSEFVIIADIRSLTSVIDQKFDRLDDLLDEYEESMPSSVHSTLSDYFDAAQDAWDEDDAEDAIAELDDFHDEVVDHSGDDISDTWRSSRDLENVAGELRSAALTLRFSLALVP